MQTYSFSLLLSFFENPLDNCCLLIVIYLINVLTGHCVEFNAAGGVIQEQISAPCNSTFPKCDTYYKSNSAYKCKAEEI